MSAAHNFFEGIGSIVTGFVSSIFGLVQGTVHIILGIVSAVLSLIAAILQGAAGLVSNLFTFILSNAVILGILVAAYFAYTTYFAPQRNRGRAVGAKKRA
ncbi:hypothetical protein FRC03_003770 [Tulasnella sp. 419]|nr:hypothetical protein FRC02_005416 [Tulasnella sp. 418]KAG8969245.1 hypothetical protein FRC03_003770 [Tulasnella sp. 419]